MKTFTAVLVLSACALLAYAEPPVPQNNYLPPSSQYGAPQFGASAPQRPSSQYGAPPSNSYIPPSNSYIPPQQPQQQQQQNNYNSQPSSSYGAPSATSAVFKQQPQSSYGAPAQSGYSNGGGNGGYGNGGGYGGGSQGGYENSGEPAHYSFEYAVQDYPSGNDFGHMESRDGDKTTGRYYVLLPDGRKQIVNYEADENGYRPTITYEDVNVGGGQGGAGGYNANAQQNNGNKFNGY